MRAREFVMKDAYSFDADQTGFEASYEAMRKAYHRLCRLRHKRCYTASSFMP